MGLTRSAVEFGSRPLCAYLQCYGSPNFSCRCLGSLFLFSYHYFKACEQHAWHGQLWLSWNSCWRLCHRHLFVRVLLCVWTCSCYCLKKRLLSSLFAATAWSLLVISTPLHRIAELLFFVKTWLGSRGKLEPSVVKNFWTTSASFGTG